MPGSSILMNMSLSRLGGFVLALLLILMPLGLVSAQYSGSFRGLNSKIRSAINKLDDEIVKYLPVPVFGVEVSELTKNFGDPRDGGDRMHEGLDILAPKGTPVVSPTEAVVTRVGNGGSSGLYVRTANPGGETFVYMHLSDFADDLEAGDVLEVGDIIGYVGNTGNAAGGPTHLHFEIRKGKALDPYPRLVRVLNSEELAEVGESAELAQIFTRDLEEGMEGDDVLVLQVFLNTKGFLVAQSGAGSPGAESKYFGARTKAALAKYQASVGIAPAAGYFGPKTRAYVALNK